MTMRDPGNERCVWRPARGRGRRIAAHKAQVGITASDDPVAIGHVHVFAHGVPRHRQHDDNTNRTTVAQAEHVPQDAGAPRLRPGRPHGADGEPGGETRPDGGRGAAPAANQHQPGSTSVDTEVPSRLSIQLKAGGIDGRTDRQARKDFS
jgi:hypothetical protein